MKYLITGCAKWSDGFFSKIEKNGDSYIFVQDERIPLKEQNIDCSSFDAVICNSLFLYNDINDFVNLKVIHLSSVGLDRLPMEDVVKKGIKVFNARGVYSIPMAEFAVTGVLSLYKKTGTFLDSQKKKEWNKKRDLLELFGKTVCIVGCGNVGTEVAKRFSAFGTKIIGVDLFKIENELYSESFLLSDIKNALKKSDIVILTLPLTKETENMFNEEMFSYMKKNSVFVNIARGKIVEEKALIKSLKNKLYGAVLDVFETEPLTTESPLWETENVIITPHNSFVGEGNIERLEKVVLENIK